MKKIICSILIIIVVLLQFSLVFADSSTVNTLQFSEIENQVLTRNLDVQADHSDSNNADINNSITNLQNMRDDMSIAMHDMVDKSLSINPATPAKVYLDDVYARMITLYSATLGTLEGQINSLKAQISNNVYSPSRVIAKNSIVWSAQQLYLMYCSLGLQKDELVYKSEQLDIKKNIAGLQKDLGMISNMDFQDLNAQVIDMSASMKILNDNMENIKGQLNLLLGQNFDVSLGLGGLPPVDNSSISAINYNKDYDTALKESLNIKLLSSSSSSDNTYRKDKEIRKLKLTFDQKYKDVLNKKSSLDSEDARRDREAKKLESAKMKYEVGLISRIDYDNQLYSLKSQVIKAKTAEQDLFKSFTVYQWLLRGYDASSN